MNGKKNKFTTKYQLIILILFAITLNINTLSNDYALDDIVVLTKNSLVEKGIKGIPELLTTDYFHGYSSKQLLTGARYRPLSLITFAIEYQFFGMNPFVSHLINILLFAILICLLYNLLRKYIFKDNNEYISFFACLIFIVHPIHTEVLANVKSRDEIITFILTCASIILFLNYVKDRRKMQLVCSGIYYFLALITKETAITVVGVVPLILFFFYEKTFWKSLSISIRYLIVFVIYFAVRYMIIGFNHYPVTDVINSPYLLATGSEAFATKVFVLIKYISLLFYPYPLSFDYGYNEIPYISITSFKFIYSIAIIGSLIYLAIRNIKNKSLISFCILFYFVTVSVGTNFIFDFGTPLAERILFEPSLVFSILCSFILIIGLKNYKIISISLFTILLICWSVKTIGRNNEWKNNETLAIADVSSSPNSVHSNLFAAEIYISKAQSEPGLDLKKEYYTKAIRYCEHSLEFLPNYPVANSYLETSYLGIIKLFNTPEEFINYCNSFIGNCNNENKAQYFSIILYRDGNNLFEKNQVDDAIKSYKWSTEIFGNNPDVWYHLGGAYWTKNDSVNATKAWDIVNKLDPNHSLRREIFLNY